jgi:hypothetical protein
VEIASNRNPSKRFPPKFGEAFPELRELRDRLLARVVDFGDMPEAWGRLLLDVPSNARVWSHADALLVDWAP